MREDEKVSARKNRRLAYDVHPLLTTPANPPPHPIQTFSSFPTQFCSKRERMKRLKFWSIATYLALPCDTEPFCLLLSPEAQIDDDPTNSE